MPFFPLLSEGTQIAQMYAQAPGGIESTTAAALATSGTITTSGPPQVAVARLAPTAAVTAVVMQKGATSGQECWVVNESATANSITMAASGTSNCAGGVNDVIPGGQGRLYVWDDQTTLWYATPQIATVTAFAQSNSAATTATSGTITTSGVNVARVAPASAITATVLQAGTVAGQVCVVVNEAAIANSVQFAASGTSNVADGVNAVVPGLQTRTFVWDSGTSLWYAHEPTVNGAFAGIQSASSPALATSGTISTTNVGVARVTPAAAVTAIVVGAGVYPGQELTIINESTTAANSLTAAASGTSNVADGTGFVVSGLKCAKLVWDSSTSLWYHAV